MKSTPDFIQVAIELAQPFTDVLVDILKQSDEQTKQPPSGLRLRLGDFPMAGCHGSSRLFCMMLNNRGIATTVAMGVKGEQNHYWLERDDWVIDLTPCQFAEFPFEAPYISCEPTWHRSYWEEYSPDIGKVEVGGDAELLGEIELRLDRASE